MCRQRSGCDSSQENILTCWSGGIKVERLDWHIGARRSRIEACRRAQEWMQHIKIFVSQVNSHQRTSTMKKALNQADNNSTNFCQLSFVMASPVLTKWAHERRWTQWQRYIPCMDNSINSQLCTSYWCCQKSKWSAREENTKFQYGTTF